jgi:hypothetical protein
MTNYSTKDWEFSKTSNPIFRRKNDEFLTGQKIVICLGKAIDFGFL